MKAAIQTKQKTKQIAIIVKENQMKLQQLISNIKESEKKKVEDFFTVI